MKQKIGIAGAVVLVIAVLASMASGAQAATSPRWLQNGTEAKLEGGELLPITMWGTLNLEAPAVGILKCKYAITGVASDPGTKGEGDLPGEAKFQGLTAYSCTGPVCELAGEPVEITALGQASNPITKSKETVGRITTPWEAHLNEPKAGEWRLKIGNKTAGSGTQIRLSTPCAGQAKTLEFHGELNPVGENGTLIGAAPAILTFKGAESGELEGTTSVTMVGKLKLMGYGSQEVISVVNQ
jgi:hypothetical protein